MIAEDSVKNRAIELWVLNALAVAQPLFAILGPNPPFFAAHRMGETDVALVLVVVLGAIPAAALLVEMLAGIAGPRAGRWVHAVICGTLVGLVARPLLDRLSGGHERVAVAGALGSAALFVLLHRRWATGRELLRFLAPAPLVFVAVFLWSEGVRSVVTRPPERHAAIEATGGTPIVFLILDELPLSVLLDEDRRIDANLFPEFARLASRSIWFRNATAKHTLTTVAVPALLTGRRAGGLRFQRAPDNVFSWLAGTHRLIAREHVTSLCPPEACEAIAVDAGSDPTVLIQDLAVVYGHWVLPRSLTRALPPVGAQWADFSNRGDPRERENLVRSFIASIADDPRPTFYFLHVLLPHVPWTGLPDGGVYPAYFSAILGSRPADDWPAAIALQRHLLQVGYVDRLVGELLDRLDATGLFDRALLVVTSDHGVAFEPGHHRRNLDDVNFRDVVHVPLFVKPPHLPEGRISDRNVESIDVLPTMADAVGLPLPFGVEGSSALDSSAPARATKSAASHGRTRTFDATLPSTWPGLQQKTVLFGRRPTWDDVWALSSAPELMGKRVDTTALGEGSGVSYAILDAEGFRDVAPANRELPNYLRGIVWAADRHALAAEIAVAVEGVIRGVGRLFDVQDSAGASPSDVTEPNASGAFAMMLPNRAFQAGENHVEAFAVGADRRLWRMRLGVPPRMSAAWPDT